MQFVLLLRGVTPVWNFEKSCMNIDTYVWCWPWQEENEKIVSASSSSPHFITDYWCLLYRNNEKICRQKKLECMVTYNVFQHFRPLLFTHWTPCEVLKWSETCSIISLISHVAIHLFHTELHRVTRWVARNLSIHFLAVTSLWKRCRDGSIMATYASLFISYHPYLVCVHCHPYICSCLAAACACGCSVRN